MLMLLAMVQVGYSAAHAARDLRLVLVRGLLRARWTKIVDWRAGELASAVGAEPARAAMPMWRPAAYCRGHSTTGLPTLYLGDRDGGVGCGPVVGA